MKIAAQKARKKAEEREKKQTAKVSPPFVPNGTSSSGKGKSTGVSSARSGEKKARSLQTDPVTGLITIASPLNMDYTPASASSVVGKSYKGLAPGETMLSYTTYEEAANAAEKLGAETRKKQRKYDLDYAWRKEPEKAPGHDLAAWELGQVKSARDKALDFMRRHASEAAPAQNIRVEGKTGGYLKKLEQWQAARDKEAAADDPDVAVLKKLDKQIATWKKALGVEDTMPEASPSDIILDGETRTDANKTLSDRLRDMMKAAGYKAAGAYTQIAATGAVSLSANMDKGFFHDPQNADLDILGETKTQLLAQYQDIIDSYGGYEAVPQDVRDYYEGQISAREEAVNAWTKRPERAAESAAALQGTAAALMDKGAQARESAGAGLGSVGQFLVNSGIAGAEMLSDVLVGAATGGGSMGAMLARSFGGGAYEAAASGADTGGQLYAGFRSAAVEYVSEKLFGGNPVYDEGAGVVNKLVSMIPNTDGLVSFLSSTPVEILSEGLEEMLSDVLNPAIDLIATGKADWPSVQQVLEDAATGVFLAGMSQGVNAAGNAISTKVTTARTIDNVADRMYNKAISHAELKPAELMNELASSGEKYTKENVLMVTKNAEGMLMWLETGSEIVGLEHIRINHKMDFLNRGHTMEEVPLLLKAVLGTMPVREITKPNSKGYQAVYELGGEEYLVAYGTNGFVVSFFPVHKK